MNKGVVKNFFDTFQINSKYLVIYLFIRLCRDRVLLDISLAVDLNSNKKTIWTLCVRCVGPTSSQMSTFNFKHFHCNEFLAFSGNAIN